MKRSVVIIAHNEEAHVEKCIKSILNQNLTPDEIILVAHNCTDNTIQIASQFPVIISELSGTPGIVYSRIHGITKATGDRIFCIDADSSAEQNWIYELDKLLQDSPNSLVGSLVMYIGNFFWTLINPINFITSLVHKNKAYWVWGPSFAFSKNNKELILNSLREFPEIYKVLNLEGYPDDCWIALKCAQISPVLQTRNTVVKAIAKEQASFDAWIRSRGSHRNLPKMIAYLKNTYVK